MNKATQLWDDLKQIASVPHDLNLRDLMLIDEAVERGSKLEVLYRVCVRLVEASESGVERSIIQRTLFDLTKQYQKQLPR